MNTQAKMKIDDLIMKKLDANNVRRPICNTNKGDLELCVLKGGTRYYLTLDSVPLEKELNDTLMDILFKVEVPQVNKLSTLLTPQEVTPPTVIKKPRTPKVK